MTSNRKQWLRIVIFVVVVLIVTFIAVPTLIPEQDQSLGALVVAIISAFTLADPVANRLIQLYDLSQNAPKPLTPDQLLAHIHKKQRDYWLNSILWRAIKNEPVDVPFTTDPEFLAKIEERAAERMRAFALAKPAQTTALSPDDAGAIPFFRRLWKSRQKSSDAATVQRQKTENAQYNVLDAYQASGGRLVLLGEGGAGKSVALLQLFEALSADTLANPVNPVPLLFNLNTWVKERLPLEEWFISELLERFAGDGTSLSGKEIKNLIQIRKFIFLLDGFNEVPEAFRDDLLAQISKFAEDSSAGSPKLVLCSRPTQYFEAQNAVATPFRMRVISLTELPKNEIQEYFEGENYFELRKALFRPNSRLLPLARKPFVLNALAIAYDNASDYDILQLESEIENWTEEYHADSSKLPIPKIIMQRYVTQQFIGATGDNFSKFDLPTTDGYLTWIARKLESSKKSKIEKTKKTKENEENTGFLVDQLQPGWLDDNLARWGYSLTSRAIGAMAIAIGVGCYLASPLEYLFVGLLNGLIIGSLDAAASYNRILRSARSSLPPSFYYVVRTLIVYILSALILTLPLGLLVPAPLEDRIWDGRLSLTGITLAWFIPLFTTVIYMTRNIRLELSPEKVGDDITTVERLGIDWKTITVFLRFGLIGGGLIGAIVGIFAEFLARQQNATTTVWLTDIINATQQPWLTPGIFGFGVGFVVGGLITGTFGLLSITRFEERLRPNQGIRASVMSALRAGGSMAVVSSSILGIALWFMSDSIDGLARGIHYGIGVGVLGALWYGGIDVIHHLALRFFLFISGGIPWNLFPFLRHSTQLNLLQEIGESYIFRHEYLRQYYAEQPGARRQTRPALAILLIGSLLAITLTHYGIVAASQFIYPLNPDNQFIVRGLTAVTTAGEQFCLEAGEQVTVKSKGLVRTGNFLGYISPEGTEIGMWGLPIGDTYDLAPHLPNNALICKLSSESDWHVCADRQREISPIWDERVTTFTAESPGCLEFDINEIEWQKRSGEFYVVVEQTGS